MHEVFVAKDALITIRVDREVKTKLEEAARSRGQSLTAFLIQEATKAANRPSPKGRTEFRGVPTFFRACCVTAEAGGGHGYRGAGYELARHTVTLLREDAKSKAEVRDLAGRLDDLTRAVAENDRAAVFAWYQREFPACLALVPARRRSVFADGVLSYFDDHQPGAFLL